MSDHIVLPEESSDKPLGAYFGNVKWFNDKLGYGFITIIKSENDNGKDIFVHHSDIKPAQSSYKTLVKGEYVQFDITNGLNGMQAVNITGVFGGPLMCDSNISRHDRMIFESYRNQVNNINKRTSPPRHPQVVCVAE